MSEETSTVTFIGEVEVNHPDDLTDEEVASLAFRECDGKDVDVLDVMVNVSFGTRTTNPHHSFLTSFTGR